VTDAEWNFIFILMAIFSPIPLFGFYLCFFD
jgi:hypothetical protein